MYINYYQIIEPEVASVEVITPARYVDRSHIICTLPEIENFTLTTSQTTFIAMHYELSGSTDHVNFGNTFNMITYNGDCVKCNTDDPVSKSLCYVRVVYIL